MHAAVAENMQSPPTTVMAGASAWGKGNFICLEEEENKEEDGLWLEGGGSGSSCSKGKKTHPSLSSLHGD